MNPTLWLDIKYINLLSFRLRNFRRKSNNVYNFSCPFCGDSQTNKRRARGFIYPRQGKLRYHCHNCNVPGYDVSRLVQHLDPHLHAEYLKEKMQDQRPKSTQPVFEKMKEPVFQKESPLKYLSKLSSLDQKSRVRLWADRRGLPPQSYHRLYFCSKFMTWVNTCCVPEKFEEKALKYDEPRLVIPFLDSQKNLLGFQGRSLAFDSELRYITVMLNEDSPKIFGWDEIQTDKLIYVVEGPLDSLFLDNCLASAGSDLTTNIQFVDEDKSKFVIIYDHEPRNREIVQKIERAIERGFKVVIWPDEIDSKDINDMVLKYKFTPNQITTLINENTYSGLPAMLRFNEWKKV